LTRICEAAYQAVEACKDETDDRLRAALFLQLPSKRLYPTYYIEIKQPIAMNIIKVNRP
jgi:ATP-dependent helicase STH1/SNF2